MTVSHMHVTVDWPNVACTNCHTIYQPDTTHGGLITGRCPSCGADKFNTTMTASTGVSFATPTDAA